MFPSEKRVNDCDFSSLRNAPSQQSCNSQASVFLTVKIAFGEKVSILSVKLSLKHWAPPYCWICTCSSSFCVFFFMCVHGGLCGHMCDLGVYTCQKMLLGTYSINFCLIHLRQNVSLEVGAMLVASTLQWVTGPLPFSGWFTGRHMIMPSFSCLCWNSKSGLIFIFFKNLLSTQGLYSSK